MCAFGGRADIDQPATRLVNTVTTPLLLKTVQSHRIDPKRLITHHFKLDKIMDAYDTAGAVVALVGLQLDVGWQLEIAQRFGELDAVEHCQTKANVAERRATPFWRSLTEIQTPSISGKRQLATRGRLWLTKDNSAWELSDGESFCRSSL
jgi:hypothetical protein